MERQMEESWIREYQGQFYVDRNKTVLSGGCYSGRLSARELHEDGMARGTFRTYTMLVTGEDVLLKGVTVENQAGRGKEAGQAIALYADADNLRAQDCHFTGHQDTLFLAPLPPYEIQKNGFLGPGQFKPRNRHIMYFSHCLIEGGVDFVFGGATAYFDNCEFRSVEPGYVFAPCTPEGVRDGFVCRNCTFTAAPGVEDESCYLGRPWREFAKVRLENCFIGAHIKKEGWHDWDKPQAHSTTEFVEIGSRGPGATRPKRPDWVTFCQ